MNLRLHQVRLPLAGFTLEIDATFDSRITGVFGPSGAGKTSLLDLIAGLRRPTAGRVQTGRQGAFRCGDGDCISRHASARSAMFRRTWRFFRTSASGPTCFMGIAIRSPRRTASLSRTSSKSWKFPRSSNAMSPTSPEVNSNGSVFARAILSAPRLLLLDEPMSSLDSRLKTRLFPFLHRIRDEFRIPFVYVTHDAGELIALCDEVLVLERGHLVERGSPGKVLSA